MISAPIAIIGAACRFPGAADLTEFAELLAEGRDAVTEVPPGRWSRALFYHPERGQPGKAYTYAAGTIPGVEQFDPMFFGISPREAVQMDPQQRLLLELTHEAIEDAGIDGSRLAGTKVGVYVGGSSSDYMTMRLGDPAGADAYFMTGSTLCSLANRISYVFDLRGPSFTVDTACSSSLVALHLACEALRGGETEAAVVGGVNLLLAPQSYVGFARASMLSPRGRCHAFDARADGYVRSEGGGVVVLKRLADALADGDMIRAVIAATGVNSDGRTTGFSLPNKAAQIDLLTEVYGRCDVSPDDLVYLEAHGTGTPVGDPIEAAAIGTVLGRQRRTPLPVGSVKTNIGHLEPASGMAGLLKVMLTLEGGIIPRSLHCETPNPSIPFDALNLRLVTERVKFARGKRPASAAVNSFGFGGTNAHTVMTAAPSIPLALADPTPVSELPPLLLSARAEGALRALATTWRQTLAKTPVDRLAPTLRGLARGREQHPMRLVVAGQTRTDLLAGLDAYLENRQHPAMVSGTAAQPNVGSGGPIVFVFSGNGSQWAGMGAEALRANPAFAAGIEMVDAALAPLLGWSLREQLMSTSVTWAPDEATLRRTDIAQPLLFAVQVASVCALRAAGISAATHIGHSAGEVAAAWAAGALSLEQAARVIAARSHRQQITHGLGRMAVLGLSQEAACKMMQGIAALDLAAINSSSSVTVAGTESGLAEIGARARAAGVLFTPLDLDYAFHSAVMNPIEAPLLADLDGLTPAEPDASFISTVTGTRLSGSALTAEYWWRNVRAPVRFADGLRTAIAEGARVFVEIGPQPVLQSYLHDAFRSADIQGRAISTLSRRHAGRDPFVMVAARCHVAGRSIAQTAAFDGPAIRRKLPAYPWQREHYWIERTTEATDVLHAPLDHPLLGFRRGAEPDAWFNHLTLATEAWLADHVVDRSVVLPAAAMIDLAWAAARARFPAAVSLELRDMEIVRPLVLESVREVTFRVTELGGFQLASRERLSGEAWTVHASGQIAAGETAEGFLAPVAAPLQHSEPAELYASAGRLGLDYGPEFRTVSAIGLAGESEAVVQLRRPAAAMLRPDRHHVGYLIDPALLDGALQGLVALAAQRLSLTETMGVLPWRFGRARLLRPAGALAASASLRVTRAGPRSVCADIAVLDAAGAVIAELSDCWFVAVPLARGGDVSDRTFHVAQIAASAAQDLPVDLLETALAAVRSPDATDTSETLVLAEAYATERAFAALAAVAGTGHPFSIADLVDAGALHPSSEALAEGLLGWLEVDGLAEARLGGWVLADTTDLPPADELWRSLLFDAPASVADTALLGLVGEALADNLSNGERPALPTPLVEQMNIASPAGAQALHALAEAVTAIADRWPAHRPLRVLELGARKGASTAWLLQCLADQVELRYVATTASADDLPSLAQRTANRDGALARLWRPHHNEGLPERDFDIILGLYPLSTLDAADLTAVHEGLAPSGMFLCVEPEPNRFWGLIFGAEANWWVRERGRSAMPLRSGQDWQSALSQTGFVETAWQPLASPSWPMALIVSRRDATARPHTISATHTGIRLFADAADRLATGLQLALAEHGRSADCMGYDAFPGALGEPVDLVVRVGDFADEAETSAKMPGILARLAASSAALSDTPPLRLWLLTRGDPAASMLVGFRRVLSNEAPNVDCRVLTISPLLDDTRAIACALGEILTPDAESEIAWTPQGREVGRVRRGLRRQMAPAGTPTRLHVARPGLLDTLGWQAATELAEPAEGEVCIAVHAAGLNFRDVMWALGLLPDEALLHGFAGPTLGLECAGVVTKLGAGVADLSVGDRVMAFAPASLGTHVVTARHAVVRMPSTMGYAEAATIPVAFLTVVYALGTLAQLAAGERVLIHGAAGGVGLAAIQYARQRGAVVFATAGSPAKRTLLRLLGVEHVLDSRSLAFADDVMRLTGGEGVDVVLNSLSGEAMERSLGLLRPFGRFLELGKRDLYRNTAVGIRPLRHNVSYFAIDADQLPVRRPALARSLFSEIETLFAEGALRPLPHRLFRFDEAAEAFRLMQTAGHIGKIVLQPADAAPVVAASRPEFTVRADRTYVLTGALDGFGLETARWLVRHGARHLALLSRRGATTPGATAVLEAWEREGVSARAFACDVANETQLSHTLDVIRAEMPDIAGVVHAAMVLDDALLPYLTAERFAAVMAPKFAGAALLDRLTRSDPIELFLLFSSVTTALGNPGQGNYVVANAALEAIAQRRHEQGLPALAVAWGPIGDAGYLARQSDVSEALLRRLGTAHLRASEALDALPDLLADGRPVLGFADLRWGAARQQLPLLNARLFSEVVEGRATEATEIDLRAMLADCSAEQAREVVSALLVEEVANILKMSPDRVDPARPLADLGMDSLMAVELRMSLEQRVGVSLPLLSLSDGATLSSMAARVVRSLVEPDEAENVVSLLSRFEPTEEAPALPKPVARTAL
jgi:acyl transferase domain-containing protein/NADPH:quinone reductase-like Zn-dependent oxidoreductase/acyl carrier protein